MKKTTEIIGIFYGRSDSGKAYRVLYLIDTVSNDTDVFEGRKCYTAFAPRDLPFAIGQCVDIVIHKGDAIVIA